MTWLTSAARIEAESLLHDVSAVVIDTETTDLYGQIVDVAVMSMSGDVLLDTLVHASEPISPEASRVHGLVQADLVDAPPIPAVAAALARLLVGRTVVAYNAAYDRSVLKDAFRSAGIASPDCRWRCAMDIYTAYTCEWDPARGRLRVPKLPAAGHRAAADCSATITLLRQIAGADPARRGCGDDADVNPWDGRRCPVA